MSDNSLSNGRDEIAEPASQDELDALSVDDLEESTNSSQATPTPEPTVIP